MFRRRRKLKSSLNDVALALFGTSLDAVRDASQALEKYLDVQQRSQLPEVEQELLFFFWFALDYWITDFVHVQEEQRTIREALSYHWREGAGGGHKGQAILETLQERFNVYAQIVNEEKDDVAKLFGFGVKLSELCGMPGNLLLLELVPHLFTVAMKSVSVALQVRRAVRRADY